MRVCDMFTKILFGKTNNKYFYIYEVTRKSYENTVALQ